MEDLRRQQRWPEAIEGLTRAHELLRAWPSPVVMAVKSNLAGAEEHLRRALALDPQLLVGHALGEGQDAEANMTGIAQGQEGKGPADEAGDAAGSG